MCSAPGERVILEATGTSNPSGTETGKGFGGREHQKIFPLLYSGGKTI